MLIKHLLALIVVAFLATGCSTVTPTGDIDVNAETAQGVNLKDYSSYAWIGSAKLVNDEQWRWEPPQFDLDAEVRWLVDSQMRQKGFVETNLNPDLLVAYVAGVNMDSLQEVTDAKTNLKTLENIPKGALLVFLMDSKTGNVVWGSTASANINQERSTDEMRVRIEYAVKKMFGGLKH